MKSSRDGEDGGPDAAYTPTSTVAEEDQLDEMHKTLRMEVELLAKGRTDEGARTISYPDPALLSEVERRVLVKAIFSFFEAICFRLKQEAVEDGTLTEGERLLALERSYDLTSHGEVRATRPRLSFLANVRFAFSISAKAAKANGLEFELDVGERGWQRLRDSVKVRDRLMHPKRVEDLLVTDAEIRACMEAFLWFESRFLVLLMVDLQQTELGAQLLDDILSRWFPGRRAAPSDG